MEALPTEPLPTSSLEAGTQTCPEGSPLSTEPLPTGLAHPQPQPLEPLPTGLAHPQPRQPRTPISSPTCALGPGTLPLECPCFYTLRLPGSL